MTDHNPIRVVCGYDTTAHGRETLGAREQGSARGGAAQQR
jgi:hypothetical protein